MDQEYEIIHYPKIKHINIFFDEITYRSQHLHSDYEFCFCFSGSATFVGLHEIIEINKGDIVFFDSTEAHSIETSGNTMIGLFVQVSNLFLRDYLPELHSRTFQNANLKDFLPKHDIDALFTKFILISKNYFKEDQNYKIGTLDAVLNLINVTFSSIPFHTLNENRAKNRRRDVERLQRITSYIDSHYQEPISLKNIASSEGITSTHLSHLFKDGFGITYQEYLSERRFECAVQLMNNSHKTITEISYESGFSDQKYFTKLFKKHFGSTPYSYKKQEKDLKIKSASKKQIILEKIFIDQESLELLKNY